MQAIDIERIMGKRPLQYQVTEALLTAKQRRNKLLGSLMGHLLRFALLGFVFHVGASIIRIAADTSYERAAIGLLIGVFLWEKAAEQMFHVKRK